jgi:V8-like Glu-specific endopeptidase
MLALVATVALAACSEEREPTGPVSASRTPATLTTQQSAHGFDQLTKILSSDAPPSYQRISADIEVRLIGKGDLVAGPPKDDEALRDDQKPGDDAEPTTGRVASAGSMRVFNSRTRLEFEVTMSPALLMQLAKEQEGAGLTTASFGRDGKPGEPSADLVDGGKTGDAGITTQGWSNGIDTRIVRSPTTAWPWRTISQFNYGGSESGCTGTLIGPRHIITAAHCINAQGTNTWFSFTVTPGRNGVGSAPYGSSFVSTSPAPGTEVWYFTPSAWRNPATSGPRQWDWGMVVIPNRLGDATGWMGYVARSKSLLTGQYNYNRGYPSCNPGFSERPAGCQTARLYGDKQKCGIGSGSYKNGDGWYRLIATSCDLSRGHSGSAISHYFYDSKIAATVPVVSMMVVSHTCFTCGPLDFYPNRARRITPGNLGTISWLRQAFP